MGVTWGGAHHRGHTRHDCVICHDRMSLLERLAGLSVCGSCDAKFPIVTRSERVARRAVPTTARGSGDERSALSSPRSLP
jgi:hypothetical protein